jgi:tetratricopeptide (TPR) repeat protein
MNNLPTGTYLKEDAEDFLDRVNEVNKQIRDLIDGKIECTDLDIKEQELKEKDRLKKVYKEIQERESQDLIRKGRPGKGH